MRRAAALLMMTALGGCVQSAPPATVSTPAPAAVAAPVAPATPPAGMQFLYGSGEAAALSRQAYAALVDNVRLRLASRRQGGPRVSVILTPESTLDQPSFVPCGDKPPAAVFDMDETLVLNLGAEYHDATTGDGFDPARWKRYEMTGDRSVAAVPGAVRAAEELRAMGVAVIVNTNRNAETAEGTEKALAFAGLGAFKHGETLFLKGDADGKSGKDGRRALIAQTYCVVALGGDQLGDFSDLFKGGPTERRALTEAPAIGGLWAHGWFILPNPVYGAGLVGSFDQIFPEDKRWVDPAASGSK